MQSEDALDNILCGDRVHHGVADEPLRCAFDLETVERFLFAVSPFPVDLIRSATASGPVLDMAGKTVNAVLKEYEAGKTLILRGLDRRIPEVALCAGNLGRHFKRDIRVNAYLTPPGAQGFPCHYDSHDVLLLQTFGVKDWQTFEPVSPTPIETASMSRISTTVLEAYRPAFEVRDSRDFGIPTEEFTLRAGEFLFLPRGVPHEGRTSNSASIHLSVAMMGITRAEFASLASFASALRGSRAAEYYDAGDLTCGFDGAAQELSTLIDIEMERGRLPVPLDAFASLNGVSNVGDNSVVGWRPNVVPRMVSVRGEAAFAFSDNVVRTSSAMRSAWEFVERNRSFHVRDIPLPASDMRAGFVKRLISLGVLNIVNKPAAGMHQQ